MSFIAQVKAKVDDYIHNSNAWDYLPAKARDILRSSGYTKTDFSASALPKSQLFKKPYAVLRYNPKKTSEARILSLHHLNDIAATGVEVAIVGGVLNIHFDLEDFHDVKEESI